MAEKSMTLYCQENGSDKMYKTEVSKSGEGYMVNCWWGPRVGTMQSGTKTKSPVSKDEAFSIWEKLVREKKAKGYHEGEEAPAYTEEVGISRDTGLRPMLLTPALEDDLDTFLGGSEWGAQEKLNGKRILVRAQGGKVLAANRRGLECSIPKAVVQAVASRELVLDGEMKGSKYFPFDLLEEDGKDLRSRDYTERHGRLVRALGPSVYPHLSVVPLVLREAQKRALLAELRKRHAEGIVFKRLRGVGYLPGRVESLSSAVAVKVKFYDSGEFVVLGWNQGRQSVSLGAFRKNGGIVSVGNVTVPAKHVWEVEANRVVQVRYLYATPAHQLYQPCLDASSGSVWRKDKAPTECLIDQLKYEGKEEE